MMTITTLIKQLDQLKEQLDGYRPIDADRYRKIMQKLQLDWNYNSNSIEGNTLTLSETKQLLYYGLTAKGKPMNDHKEMEGHAQVLKEMEEIVHQDIRLTESLIKAFHKMILIPDYDNSKEKDVEINPGEWKKQPNYLLTPTGEKLEFLAPTEVPTAMNELMNWANNHLGQNKLNRHSKKKYQLHPLKVACGFHKRFIDIHPFGDGNGRMARILMNLILMQQGYMPAIVYLEQRQAYYTALNSSTFEDISPLASYIGQNLMQSMQLAIDGAQGKSVEEQKDWMKELSVIGRTLEDRKRTRGAEEWSIENQKSIIENTFVPFIEMLYEASRSFKPLYDQTEWRMDPDKYVSRILQQKNKLIGKDEIIKGFKEWKVIVKKKASYNRVKNVILQLKSSDKRIKGMAIQFLFSLETAFYEISYQLKGVTVSLHESTYNEVIEKSEIDRWTNLVMSNIVSEVKEKNNPS